jgi:hypothetical protein
MQARRSHRASGATSKKVGRPAARKPRRRTTKKRSRRPKTTIRKVGRMKRLTRKQIAAGFGGKAAQKRLRG